MRAVVVGATGAIGKCVVTELLKTSAIAAVTVLVRRAGSFPANPKLTERVFDFEAKEDKESKEGNPFVGIHAVFCCLGSTIKAAGSEAVFYKIDHDYVINVARLAADAGVPHFSYCSSVGANARSSTFYLKTKGQIEEDIKGMRFTRVSIFRPSVLVATRQNCRCGEWCGAFFTNFLCYVCICCCCAQYAGISVETVGRAMVVDAVLAAGAAAPVSAPASGGSGGAGAGAATSAPAAAVVGAVLYDGSDACEKVAARQLEHSPDVKTSLLRA